MREKSAAFLSKFNIVPKRAFVLFFASVLLPVSAIGSSLYERSLSRLEAMLQKQQPSGYSFVVLGDSRDNDTVFRKALWAAARYHPLFILHTGDLSSRGTAGETGHFLQILQETVPDIPVFVVIGNHEKKRKIFEKEIGPAEYTLDLSRIDTRVIIEDNSGYSLKTPQLQYLKRQLAGKRRYTFVALHIPPKTARWSLHTFSDGASDLIRLAGENRVNMAFFGHIHLYDEDTLNGVKYLITGGAGAPLTSFGFSGDLSYHLILVTVKNGTVSKKVAKIE